jgi:homoserine kinase
LNRQDQVRIEEKVSNRNQDVTNQLSAIIRVPGSTSNLGPAFDAVGLALGLHLRVEVSPTAGPSKLSYSGEDERLIPCNGTNLIWRVMESAAGRFGGKLPPFDVRVNNEIPITKGLGSSASACLAGAAAAGLLCGLQLTAEDLLEFVSELEGHPDNVAPSLYGGLVASISGKPVRCSRCLFPDSWSVVAVTPALELETKRARAVLPPVLSYKDAVFNVQRSAFLMAQIVQGRREGIREAMRDRLHQPYRCDLLPGLREILDMPDQEGLVGVALSGAGSTVVAFADGNAEAIGESIRAIFRLHGLSSQVRVLKPDNTGLTIQNSQVGGTRL